MDAITRDEPEVLVDETTRMVRAKLSGPISDMYSASWAAPRCKVNAGP